MLHKLRNKSQKLSNFYLFSSCSCCSKPVMLLNFKQSLISLVALALGAASTPLEARANVAFFSPAAGGGSMLDNGKCP